MMYPMYFVMFYTCLSRRLVLFLQLRNACEPRQIRLRRRARKSVS